MLGIRDGMRGELGPRTTGDVGSRVLLAAIDRALSFAGKEKNTRKSLKGRQISFFVPRNRLISRGGRV